ncbi:calmodulin-binding protein 60 B-like, partial [Bidens hawaiensis]|uniref:calmodulin-binding protein 60 B-like n=1 Tax=Bidens hawaiensis TaxID=980011 RepID=UPI00404BA119
MVFKRSLGDEEEGFTADKRRIISSNFAQNVPCGLSSQELASTLEPLIRRWVRDEVQRSCQMFFHTLTLPSLELHRSSINATEPARQTTSLQLRFQAKWPQIFFTGNSIESEDKKLMLVDVKSNRIVSSGPFSSLKVEIVPLDGDFSFGNEEDWSEKEFDAKVISARDGRRPLITGNLVVTLQNGVADL